MILDPNGRCAISSLGWVDGDSLWCWSRATREVQSIPLKTGARWTSVHAGASDRFVAAHHFDGVRFELTVRAFAAPDEVLARAVVGSDSRSLSGDRNAWIGVPQLYVEYLAFAPYEDFSLISLAPHNDAVEVHRLPWYDESYDKGYQGVIGVLQVPAADVAIVSVQRSARLVLHDLQTGQARRAIDIADRTEVKATAFREDAHELWVHAYDAAVVLDTKEWRPLRSVVLQAPANGVGQFMGEMTFAPDDGICIVARPYSGDVVGVDVVTLKIGWRAKTGAQPLEVAALGAGEVVARDWKTGATISGTLRWDPL
jgi:hypothetical protein